MLGEYNGVTHYVPQISDGVWFVAEFFALFAGVSAISVMLMFREKDLTAQQAALGQREAALAAREQTIAERETAVFKREGEDLLTEFREKLAGPWEVEFRSWEYDTAGRRKQVNPIDHAHFTVDKETQKLEIRLRVRKSEDWQEKELMVRAISIQPVKNPETIDYYHEVRLETIGGRAVIGAIFTHLMIEYRGIQPTRLHGTWYDLDGSFARAKKDLMIERGLPALEELPTSGSIQFEKL